MWVFPCRHLPHLSFPPGWDDSDNRGNITFMRPLRRLIDLVQGMKWHML
jgi:hypothetical protein